MKNQSRRRHSHEKKRNLEDKSKIKIITAKVRLNRDIAEEAYSLSDSDMENISFPVEFEITKFADGSRNFSSEMIDIDPIKRINSMASEVARNRDMANSILSNNQSDTSEEMEKIVDELIQIHERSYDTGNPSDISEIVGRAEKIVEISDSIDKEIGSREEVLSGIRQHLNNAKTEVTPPEPNILYYDNYELIDYQYDFKFENDDCPFADMLDVGGFSKRMFENADDKERYLDDISMKIADRINEAWSQKEVEVSIRHKSDSTLSLYVRDLTASDDEEVNRPLTKISDRSDGFRWFFSFYVDILKQSNGQNLEEKILLFDDPAIRLHPEGKRDWLKTVVDEVGQTDQVIYTAHSPYLIDKDHPSRMRIVQDTQDKGTIIRKDVLDPEADPDSLEPLRNALGINLGDSPFISKKTVLVEGPSDYYIITGVLNYFKEYEDRYHFESGKVTINPTNGASQMPALASWLSSQDIDFAMVLDSDDEGQEVLNKIENNRYLGIEPDDVSLLSKPGLDEDVVIEDLIPTDYYLESFNTVLNNIADEIGVNYRNISVSEQENAQIGVKSPSKEGWEIGPIEYGGTGFDEVLEKILGEQQISSEIRNEDGDIQLFKRQVAENVHSRMSKGNVEDDDLVHFNSLLGDIGSILGLR